MPPKNTLKPGCKVVVTRVVKHGLTSVTEKDVGKHFTVKGVDLDGRSHNRYIASVTLVRKDGYSVRAIVDQLASCTPNFEPGEDYIVCLGCGATFSRDKIQNVRRFGKQQGACPFCGTLDCDQS